MTLINKTILKVIPNNLKKSRLDHDLDLVLNRRKSNKKKVNLNHSNQNLKMQTLLQKQ